jgi:monomeric isocitrate dehydrogenase
VADDEPEDDGLSERLQEKLRVQTAAQVEKAKQQKEVRNKEKRAKSSALAPLLAQGESFIKAMVEQSEKDRQAADVAGRESRKPLESLVAMEEKKLLLEQRKVDLEERKLKLEEEKFRRGLKKE